MSKFRRYWFALHPDLNRPIGGIKQVHRLAECITDLGREAILIQDSADFHPGWFESNVKTISHHNWLQLSDLNPNYDVLVLPETFLPGLLSYDKTLPKIIFNQNGAYSFGLSSSKPFNPSEILKLYQSNAVSHVFCVSQHDFSLLTSGFSLPDSKVSLIVNALETDIFYMPTKKKRQIAFMPRKNAVDSRIVSSLVGDHSWFKDWSFAPIVNCSQKQVAYTLQESLLFFSFGHPEGFGLPVAEALACGCGLIGYSGLGGRELFSLSKKYQISDEVAFGDWYGFVDSTFRFISAFDQQPKRIFTSLRDCSFSIRSTYAQEAMLSSVDMALSRYEASC